MSRVDFCRAGCGGKAAELCALQAAGFDVPEFEISPPDLAAVVERLGFPLVVRSSATLEDGERASFAGQFRSFLRLRTIDQVRQAIAQCLASVDSPEIREYCVRLGIPATELRMQYIVQRMIEPELAGVVFTVDPVRGTDNLVVNACAGLGDDLLAGRVSPLPSDHPLLLKYLPQITQVARRVERHFGAPQDIEFAAVGGQVYVVQARPITRIAFDAIEGEWTSANFRDGGVSSDVCSALMWSLYELIWNASIKSTLREARLWTSDFEAARLYYGRPYWNLGAVKRSVALLPGFVEREFDDDLGVEVTYDGPGRVTPFRLGTVWRALVALAGVRGFLRRHRRAALRLLDHGLSDVAPLHSEHRAEATWRELIERDYFDMETTYFRSVFAVSLVKQDFKRAFPDCDYSALVAALPPLRHLAPIQRMRAMAESGHVDVPALVAEFPHPSRWGLDIRHPRWDEEPEFVAQLARSLPPTPRRDPREDYQRAYDDATRALPLHRRHSFRRKLRQLRECVWLREELRDVSSRMYHLIRRQARHIAEKRGLGDDIFHMTYTDVLRDDRSQIGSRKETFQRYRRFRAPREIGRRYRFDPASSNDGWRGIGASAGVARGLARIAFTVDEASQLPAGCVLICPFTEPSWTSILDRFAAVVAETGGQLSHAAVLCREFGIPAVLGIADATRRIADGTPVIVHGGEGWVARDMANTVTAGT